MGEGGSPDEVRVVRKGLWWAMGKGFDFFFFKNKMEKNSKVFQATDSIYI